MPEERCNRCGELRSEEDWYARSDGRRQPWCKPCYRDWHRQRYQPKAGADDAPRSCEECGASYRPTQRRASNFCSRACKDLARRKRDAAAREARKALQPRRCLQCGSPMPPAMRADAKFCSTDCNSNAHALKRKLRARGGARGEIGYVRLAIAERDRWRCGICGGQVAQERKWPDPLCGSLDHVVPVSQGGTSDPENLRLTHLRCNVTRRDKGGGEQLALH